MNKNSSFTMNKATIFMAIEGGNLLQLFQNNCRLLYKNNIKYRKKKYKKEAQKKQC